MTDWKDAFETIERLVGERFTWTTLDGQSLTLDRLTDPHLVNVLRLKARRFWIGLGSARQLCHGKASEFWGELFEKDKSFCLLWAEAMRRKLKVGKVRIWFRQMVRLGGVCEGCKAGGTDTPRGPTDRLMCEACFKAARYTCLKCERTLRPDVRALGVGTRGNPPKCCPPMTGKYMPLLLKGERLEPR